MPTLQLIHEFDKLVPGGEKLILEIFNKLTSSAETPQEKLKFMIDAETKLTCTASKYFARLISAQPVSTSLCTFTLLILYANVRCKESLHSYRDKKIFFCYASLNCLICHRWN